MPENSSYSTGASAPNHPTKHEGKLTISRVSGRDDENSRCFKIELTDTSSGCRVIEIRLDPATLANCLSAMAYQPCEFTIYRSAPIGKPLETKQELVDRPVFYRGDKEAKAEAARILSPFEVDGWKAIIDDIWNSHRWRGDKVSVFFRRYVDQPEGGAK